MPSMTDDPSSEPPKGSAASRCGSGPRSVLDLARPHMQRMGAPGADGDLRMIAEMHHPTGIGRGTAAPADGLLRHGGGHGAQCDVDEPAAPRRGIRPRH